MRVSRKKRTHQTQEQQQQRALIEKSKKSLDGVNVWGPRGGVHACCGRGGARSAGCEKAVKRRLTVRFRPSCSCTALVLGGGPLLSFSTASSFWWGICLFPLPIKKKKGEKQFPFLFPHFFLHENLKWYFNFKLRGENYMWINVTVLARGESFEPFGTKQIWGLCADEFDWKKNWNGQSKYHMK